jgi:hypothetical protein
MADISIKLIVNTLQDVPEKKFRITELAGQLIDDAGKVDILKAMDQQGELNIAIAEVESYIKANKRLLESIYNMDTKTITGNEL